MGRAIIPAAVLAVAYACELDVSITGATERACVIITVAVAAFTLWRAAARIGTGASSNISPFTLSHWVALLAVTARIVAAGSTWMVSLSLAPTIMAQGSPFTWAFTVAMNWFGLV